MTSKNLTAVDIGVDSLFVNHDRMREIRATAEALIKSGMLPQHIKSASQAVAIMLKGREMGIPPVAALSQIYVIGGKAEMQGSAMEGVLRRGGVNIEPVEWDADKCVLRFSRKVDGDVIHSTYTYTMAEAKRAGLDRNANYQKHPMDMLYWRCLSRGSRRFGADLVHGCYVHGELSEVETVRDVRPLDMPEGATKTDRVAALLTQEREDFDIGEPDPETEAKKAQAVEALRDSERDAEPEPDPEALAEARAKAQAWEDDQSDEF